MIWTQITSKCRQSAFWLALIAGLVCLSLVHSDAQPEQTVEVTIRNSSFIANQAPLQLMVPTRITIRNEDQIRHNFSSRVLERGPTRVEHDGVTSYGRGIEGVFLDSNKEVNIRFTIETPGRYEFRCSIHPGMKGEILLLSVSAV
ncbi:MAG: cupredoxin domain-containing protein [Nitrospiraceae bacterium]